MSTAEHTASVQDYLKEIYKLQLEEGRASTSAIAERMRVAPPSATAMVKKLALLGLVEHAPYHGVVLTTAGMRSALEVIRHHRLLELYLAQSLGLPIDAIHAEADRLEHALSEQVEARIDEQLGFPRHDPHGDPIPDATLTVEPSDLRPLSALAPRDRAVVRRVPDGDAELLRYLAQLDMLPGRAVEVVEVATFDGVVTVRTASGKHALSRELAGRIGVA